MSKTPFLDSVFPVLKELSPAERKIFKRELAETLPEFLKKVAQRARAASQEEKIIKQDTKG